MVPANGSGNVECIANATAPTTPTVTDVCGNSITPVLISTVDNPSPLTCNGTRTFNYTYTDCANLSSGWSYTYTINDNIKPTITCPGTVNVNTNPSECTASGVLLGTPITSDNCGVSSVINNAPSIYSVGSTTVTWTVYDCAGNSATCPQNVYVTDNIPPQINCPGDISVCQSAGQNGATVNYNISASDNCSYVFNQIAGLASGSFFPIGQTKNVFVATDPSGNTDTCRFLVTVNPLPTVTVNGNPLCQGSAGTLTANANGVSYLWSTGATSQSISVRDGNTYSVTVTDLITACQNTASGNLTVQTSPTVSVNESNCVWLGKSINLTSNYTGTPTPTFQWYLQGNLIAGATNATYQKGVSDGNDYGEYSLVVTNSCGSDTGYVTLEQCFCSPLKPVVIEDSVCGSGTGNLCVGGIPLLQGITYQWDDQDSSTNQCITVGDGNTYCVIVSVPNNGEMCPYNACGSLIINPLPTLTVTGNPICQSQTGTLTANASGVSFAWNTGATTQSINVSDGNTYTVLVTDSITACQNTATGNLIVLQNTSSHITESGCDSLIINGQVYTSSGSYTQNLTNAAGCDSTIYLNLTIRNSTTSNLNVTAACDSFLLNGVTYKSSGYYTQNFTNAAGCDSTLTINLILQYSNTSELTASSCDNFTLNGTTYTSSGDYTQSFINEAGCDSTLTLHLTIHYSTTSDLTEIACDSYTLNGFTYTSSDTYTQYLKNAAGCDSTLTLHLTINKSTHNTFTETGCDSYLWADNGQTYTSSGTYTYDYTNGSGCPSTDTLHLTIYNSTHNVYTDTSYDSYSWSENGTTYFSSGTYTYTYINGSGCQSTDTLHLTININKLIAVPDSGSVNGYTGGTAVNNVLSNDSLNGQVVNPADVKLTVVGTLPTDISLDTTTGTVTVAPGTPAGTYTFTYQICDIIIPTNCSSTTVTIDVTAPPIVAIPDSGTVNGYTGDQQLQMY